MAFSPDHKPTVGKLRTVACTSFLSFRLLQVRASHRLSAFDRTFRPPELRLGPPRSPKTAQMTRSPAVGGRWTPTAALADLAWQVGGRSRWKIRERKCSPTKCNSFHSDADYCDKLSLVDAKMMALRLLNTLVYDQDGTGLGFHVSRQGGS